jgi:hypothetical protein
MRALLTSSALLLLAMGAAWAASLDLWSDTWVATDALGRKLPTYEECGPPRPGKTVAIFYFVWLGAHENEGPYDITKILAANPNNPQWGPKGAFHHWGEPEVGYYLSNDTWVIRRHVEMLNDAGIDLLVLDATNAFTYHDNYMLLCRVLEKVKAIEGKCPKIAFMCNSRSVETVTKLYNEFYSKCYYPSVWFRWQGKPLMLSSDDGLPQHIRDFFTFRQSWAWSHPNGWFKDGKDKWPWLDNYPQAYGWHEPGQPEEISVCVAQHPTSYIGRSFHNGRQPGPNELRTAEGLCFAEQWRRALEVDPEVIFITGWNEWVAQRYISNGENWMLGRKLAKGETYFVDTYNQEFSRDIEPMKGGHTDNYYYQMIANIRRFKGVRKHEPSSPPKTISIDGKFGDWTNVRPEYRDHIGDTEHRNSQGWGDAGRYINTTGRNDFIRSKVSRDATNVYFYVETREPVTPCTDPNWMLLFIDVDQDSKTGWHGYDYLVNFEVIDHHTTTLMRTDKGWNWKPVAKLNYRVSGNKMELAVPIKALGLAGKRVSLDFHWADNIQKPDDIIEFAVSGDSAPNRRFNYRYVGK